MMYFNTALSLSNSAIVLFAVLTIRNTAINLSKEMASFKEY